jgi:methylmalonyl-CoA/ethylmalonyl-CoA epimerase
VALDIGTDIYSLLVISLIINRRGNMVTKVDHIGIAVKSLDEALKFYENVLGIKCVAEEVVEEQKVKTAFLPLGDTEIELLESTSDDGPIAKFIEKKGEGIQHIAYKVDDIEKALEELKSRGVRLIDEKPRKGAGGAKIAFLHPKSTFGVLIEICQRD